MFCHLKGRSHIRLLATNQSQQPSYSVHMRIQRDNQACRFNPRPSTEVHSVGPDHPPEEKIQTLAGATFFRRGQKHVQVVSRRGTQLSNEQRESRKHRGVPFRHAGEETSLQRAKTSENFPDSFQEARHLLPRCEAMFEILESLPEIVGRISHDKF